MAQSSTDSDRLEERLRQCVAFLASAPRPAGSAHLQAVRAMITTVLRGYGYDVTLMAVANADPPCINLIAVQPGADPHLPRLVVGAHIDSMPDVPGADDNASAVAALLELAGLFAHEARRAEEHYRLELAFYDREESGLIGSQAHADSCVADGTLMIALEMLGYASHVPGSQASVPGLPTDFPGSANFLLLCADDAATDLAKRMVAAMRACGAVELIALLGDVYSNLPWTRLSDHASFWDRHMAAIVVTDTGPLRNRHYHRNTDRPDTLDYRFLAANTRALAQGIGTLLGVEAR